MKNKVGVRVVAGVCAFMVLACPAFAHSGRTDSKGGHYDRSTGEYHYHHGYKAHQHENGVCPYDYKDATDHSPRKSTKPVRTSATPRPTVRSTLKPAVTAQPRTTLSPAAKKKKSEQTEQVVTAVGVGSILTVYVLAAVFLRRK